MRRRIRTTFRRLTWAALKPKARIANDAHRDSCQLALTQKASQFIYGDLTFKKTGILVVAVEKGIGRGSKASALGSSPPIKQTAEHKAFGSDGWVIDGRGHCLG
jgi:hypothetical protein